MNSMNKSKCLPNITNPDKTLDRVTVILENDLKRKFKMCCMEKNITMTDALYDFISDFVGEEA